MNTIKNVAKDFLHRDGHNTTEASQDFRPAVTQNYIQPTSTSQETTVLDREAHQHHYQTRLQPVRDRVERKAEHVENVLPVEERAVREGNPGVVEKKLAEERAMFQPSTKTLSPTHSTLPSTTQTAAHTHHHIHETIQPIIEREVIQPTVVHTTKPVHETVEKAPQVHPPTVQPVMTMEEFQRDGGRVEGKEDARTAGERRIGEWEGEPVVSENGGAERKWPEREGKGAEITAVGRNGGPGVMRRASVGSISNSSSVSSLDEAGAIGAVKGNYTTTTSTTGSGNRNNFTNKNNMNNMNMTSNPSLGTSSSTSAITPTTTPAATTPTTFDTPLTGASTGANGPGSSIDAPHPHSSLNKSITYATRNTSLSGNNNSQNGDNPGNNNNARNDGLHHDHQRYGDGRKDPRYIARDGMRDHGQNALPIVREGRLGGALS